MKSDINELIIWHFQFLECGWLEHTNNNFLELYKLFFNFSEFCLLKTDFWETPKDDNEQILQAFFILRNDFLVIVMLENYIIKMRFWGINLSGTHFDIWLVYVKSCSTWEVWNDIYMLKMMFEWMKNWYFMCTQWVRKLKEILVAHRKESHLVTGKFNPMNLYTFACSASINIDQINANLCWLVLDFSF